jgi:hypothetical protein
MPTAGPVLGEALTGMLAGRGITLHPECSVERIDPAAGEVMLTGGETACYNLLLPRRLGYPVASSHPSAAPRSAQPSVHRTSRGTSSAISRSTVQRATSMPYRRRWCRMLRCPNTPSGSSARSRERLVAWAPVTDRGAVRRHALAARAIFTSC